MSATFYVLSLLLPTAIGPFWGFYVGRRYRRWKMTQDVGLILALAPPVLISMIFGVASVLTQG